MPNTIVHGGILRKNDAAHDGELLGEGKEGFAERRDFESTSLDEKKIMEREALEKVPSC